MMHCPPELKQTLSSRRWRLWNLYAIEDERGRLVKFRPNWAQADFYPQIWWRNYVLKSRQHGFSTFIAMFLLDRLLFEPNKTAGIVDFKLPDAKKKLKKLKIAYDHLDDPDLHPDTWEIGARLKHDVPLVSGEKSPTPEVLAWENGSSIYASTSPRGDTLQYFWVSEFGKIAFKFPEKAGEIQEAVFEAAHAESIGFVETTHKGGKTGHAYELTEQAMEQTAQAAAEKRELTRLEWRFHFYGWADDPKNALGGAEARNTPISEKLHEYFRELRARGIELTRGQKAWYAAKARTLHEAVKSEHPTTPEEAFEGVVEGSIYGAWITAARAEGRVVDFPMDPKTMVHVFFDLGISDQTALWFAQLVGQQILLVDWFENYGEPIAYYAEHINRWQREHKRTVAGIYLPHDGDARQLATGRTLAEEMAGTVTCQVLVVPRTPNIWLGIDATRDLLPKMWFHRSRCGTGWKKDGRTWPSGLDCLDNYHTHLGEQDKATRSEPVHDVYSHSASALRTLAEAVEAGLIIHDQGGDWRRLQHDGPARVVTGRRKRR